MKVKEESEKVGLKLNIQKTKTTVSGPITSWQIDRETMEISERLYFQSLQLRNHVRLFATPWTKACQIPCPSLTPRAHLNSYLLSR